MGARGWELVAADESTIGAEPVLDAIVVKDPECDRRFPDPLVPMRATDLRFSAKAMIVSISSSRPKQAPGGGGGNSPCGTLCKHVKP